MIKKGFILVSIILVIIGLCGSVYADNNIKTKLDVIQDQAEVKDEQNTQFSISKKIVDADSENGEITIELNLDNITEQVYTEIFFVVDNSASIGRKTSTGEIRRDIIVNAIRELTNKIYDENYNVKLGLVRFSSKAKTIQMCNLTDEKQTMIDAIDELDNLGAKVNSKGVKSVTGEGETNIEAGLKLASDNFSSDCKNKILVLLTDGIPTSSLTHSRNTQVYDDTKARLETLEQEGVSVISMMTGIGQQATNSQNTVIERIFGTPDNPTAGKFYNIEDSDIEEIAKNYILKDVVEKINNIKNYIQIVDYFPQEIVDNFDFSYDGNPDQGTISNNIDIEKRSITWDTGTLKNNEKAKVRYKLKIKDMQNTKLLNKVIDTNEKIIITYKDKDGNYHVVESTSNPKIRITEIKDESKKDDNTTNNIIENNIVKDTNTTKKNKTKQNANSKKKTNTNKVSTKKNTKKDSTTAKKVLPRTGLEISILLGGIAIAVGGAIIVYKKYNKLDI